MSADLNASFADFERSMPAAFLGQRQCLADEFGAVQRELAGIREELSRLRGDLVHREVARPIRCLTYMKNSKTVSHDGDAF